MRQICSGKCLCPKFLLDGEELRKWQEEIKIPTMLGSCSKNSIRGIDMPK